MKFNLNFLKEYIAIPISAQELADRLTMAGIQISSMTESGGDTLFDVEITSNRADLLSIIGLSHEVAALLHQKSHTALPPVKALPPAQKMTVTIENTRDCPFYRGVILEGVSVKPSSSKIRECLTRNGFLSINTVVDTTNYSMLKWGHPLHAFDLDKLKGNIQVRRARRGEKLLGIDNKERVLDEYSLVIADDVKVVALAGVIGGRQTEITETTTRVFLEAALFAKGVVRTSRRRAGVSTESSYRFERETVARYLFAAQDEAVDTMVSHAGARIVGSAVCGTPPEDAKTRISISVPKMNAYVGTQIDKYQIQGLLEAQQCVVEQKANDVLDITAPFFRKDIVREVDVYEEIVRLYGYDNIPLKTHDAPLRAQGPEEAFFDFKNTLRVFLRGQRLNEIITYCFLNDALVSLVEAQESLVEIVNPLKKDERYLRPALYLTALDVIGHNLRNNARHLRFFEIGDSYMRQSGTYKEETRLGLYYVEQEDVSFYTVKQIVESLIQAFCGEPAVFSSVQKPFLSEGLQFQVRGGAAGYVGIFSGKVLEKIDSKKRVFVADLSVPALFAARLSQRKYKEFSRFPEVVRDISLALRLPQTFDYIRQKIQAAAPGFLCGLEVVDTYTGEKIGPGLRGYTVRFRYQSNDRTLSNDEVDKIHAQVRSFLTQDGSILLR